MEIRLNKDEIWKKKTPFLQNLKIWYENHV